MDRSRFFKDRWKELVNEKQDPRKNAKSPKGPSRAEVDELPSETFRAARVILDRYRYYWLALCGFLLMICLLSLFRPASGLPTRVPVAGRVLVDGQPLARGMINFIPAAGRASTAVLGTDGSFALTCLAGKDGALPGTHRIEILPDGSPIDSEEPWPVPKWYARWETSGLQVEIDGPQDDLNIELTTQDAAASGGSEMGSTLRAEGQPLFVPPVR
jgi:hypothetical protein